MTPESKIDYFIKRTDERLSKMDAKLDGLIGFEMKLKGMAVIAGGLAAAALELAKFLIFGK